MKKACVIGWPIKHSRSPVIHNHWLAHYGLDGSYEKVAVAPDDARAWLSDLAGQGFVGCNVTVPHKETAFALAAQRDPSADAVQAANTLWLEDGRLCAANTDTYGFMRNLEETIPDWRSRRGPVLILGAGGAARAIAHGFTTAGCETVLIANRTHERATAMVEALGHPALQVVPWEQRQHDARTAGVIVNTTTLGMDASSGDDGLGLDLTQCENPAVVCDIVYVPLITGLLAHAQQHGHAIVDGLGMLLHQAVPGFEKWFGVRPRVTSELRDAVLADLAGTP